MAHLGHRGPVHRNISGSDVDVRITATAHPRVGYILVQAHQAIVGSGPFLLFRLLFLLAIAFFLNAPLGFPVLLSFGFPLPIMPLILGKGRKALRIAF